MANLWPLSLRESFDFGNPWVRRATGLGFARAQRKERLLRALAFALALGMIATWIAAYAIDDPVLFERLGDISWALCVGLAFVAPSLGAAARRRIDYDPCLPESLATPVTDRQYIASLHGAVLLDTSLAFLIAGAVAAGLWAAIAIPTAASSNSLIADSLLRVYLRMIDYQRMTNESAPLLPWLAGAAAIVLTANYAAGFYLHSSILAGHCQRDRMANFNGGVMTTLLIMLMMLLLFVRYFGVLDVAMRLFPREARPLAAPVMLIVIDGAVLAARLWWARRVWQQTLDTAMDATRGHVL